MTMFDRAKNVHCLVLALGFAGCVTDPVDTQSADEIARPGFDEHDPPGHPSEHPNSNGTAETVGPIDHANPFFKSLGTNGRACVTCHQEDQGFSITPAGVQARFRVNNNDPLFRLVDGSVSPNADVSTPTARAAAYQLLLSRGLIRIGLPIPANAEFTLIDVDDPYHFASANQLSLFRRPPSSTSLLFLSTIMWDGREPDLAPQIVNATLGHAQATSTNQADMDAILRFETGLYTAQRTDSVAGPLDQDGALGGALALSRTQFFIGINDPLGFNPRNLPFDPNVFTLFNAFAPPAKPKKDAARTRQYAIFRGQQLFNTRPITISGVKGLNDFLGVDTLQGTCTTCHDTPNVGNHSIKFQLDIGLTTEARRTPDLPLYTLRNNLTNEVIKTTDPGRALLTGRWADVNKFKGPILRGLSARPPYFHNGSAATLDDVVGFYDTRFALGLTAQERSDLVAFLQAL